MVRVFGRTCGMSSGVVVGPIGGTGIPDAGIRRGTARSFRARNYFSRPRFKFPERFEPGDETYYFYIQNCEFIVNY